MLNAKVIEDAVKDCLFEDNEFVNGSPPDNAVIIKGITAVFSFNPERIEKHSSEIISWIDELPEQFLKNAGGGGWTFLNLPVDRNDHLWGQQKDAQNLLVLCMAINKADYCLPRDMWHMLPGGVPYVWFSK